MKLPKWFPTVPQPWNPAYRDTWKTMSEGERQWSCLVDVVLFVSVISLIFWLGG